MYESECMLREESCKRQIEIHIQDKHMCNGCEYCVTSLIGFCFSSTLQYITIQ